MLSPCIPRGPVGDRERSEHLSGAQDLPPGDLEGTGTAQPCGRGCGSRVVTVWVVGTEVAGGDLQQQDEVPAPAWTEPLPITIPIATCSSLIPGQKISQEEQAGDSGMGCVCTDPTGPSPSSVCFGREQNPSTPDAGAAG